MWLGPNAVLAFKREGYSPFDFSMKDFSEAAAYRLVLFAILSFNRVFNDADAESRHSIIIL